MTLSAAERDRYADQLSIPGWGEDGQRALRAASAIVVGAGALGAPAAAYLAAAGVGRIGIVDEAPVDLPGLARQIVHLTAEVGANRAEAAALRVGALNSEVHAEPYPVRLDEQNAVAIVAESDLVLECSNDEATRRLVNDACCGEGTPLVEAGLEGGTGFLLSIRPHVSACHRCADPVGSRTPRGGDRGTGTVGAVAGALGAMQALEGLKLLTGHGRPLLDRVLRLEDTDLGWTSELVARHAGCPACADGPTERQSS